MVYLFCKVMEGKLKEWKNFYMVVKCLWKMYIKVFEELDEKICWYCFIVKMILRVFEKIVEVLLVLLKFCSG